MAQVELKGGFTCLLAFGSGEGELPALGFEFWGPESWEVPHGSVASAQDCQALPQPGWPFYVQKIVFHTRASRHIGDLPRIGVCHPRGARDLQSWL